MVSEADLSNVDLCILYYDLWTVQVPPEATTALESFVRNGGGVLVVHNGISLQSDPRFRRFIGAEFTTHPERQKVLYAPVAEHAITQGIAAFELVEELYLFTHYDIDRFTVLLQGRLKDEQANALWIRELGRGRLAYCAIGHDATSLSNPIVGRLLLNTALWAVKGLCLSAK